MKKKLFSMLLVLAMVLTMATSVSAAFYLPTDAEFTTPMTSTYTFDGYESGTPSGWAKASATQFKPLTFDDEHGTALAFRNWYNNPDPSKRVEGVEYGDSNGKIFNMKCVSGTTSTEVMMEFDLYHATGSAYSIGYGDAYSSSTLGKNNRKTVMGVSGSGKLTVNSVASGYIPTDEWCTVRVYLNFIDNVLAVYVDDELRYTGTSATLAGSVEFHALYVYLGMVSTETYKVNNVTYGVSSIDVWSAIDNVTIYNRSTPATIPTVPSFYPADMDYFETFDGTYLDQTESKNSKYTYITNDSSGVATLAANSAEWMITESGHIQEITFPSYTQGGADKYLDLKFNYLGDNYLYFKFRDENGAKHKFKTFNYTEEDDGTRTYSAPTFNPDLKYFYFTMQIGGFASAKTNPASTGNFAPGGYLIQFETCDADEDGLNAFDLYVNDECFRVGAVSNNNQFDTSIEEPDKMYKVDIIVDTTTGVGAEYVDGRHLRTFNASKWFTSDGSDLTKKNDNDEIVPYLVEYFSRAKIATRYSDSLRIDNIGYKFYSATKDDGTERTYNEVRGDVFGTPRLAYFEVLSNSTKSQLNVLARGNALNADGTAAGNMIIASYDGNRLTNVVYQPSSVGAECSAAFTNDLAATDKIACYFFGAQGTAKEMQPLVDAKYIDYNNSAYTE